MKKGSLLLFSAFLFMATVFSQELEDEKYNIIEQRVDFLLDLNEGGDIDFTTLFEQLEIYYNRPINLNSAKKLDLLDLGLLNDIQINNLQAHIEKNGKLITFEELQSIEAFDLETIQLIQPFTKVGGDLDQAQIPLKSMLSEGNSSYFIRYSRILEEQEGFSSISAEELTENENSRYLGSPDKLFSRYRFTYSNNLSLGFTTEKDPGEEFFKGSQKNGFDFYSAHLFVQGFGVIKQLAIGDFQAQFGQGLTFWSGLAFGRSPSVFTLKRNAQKLRPYTSVQEDLFMRGGGVTVQKRNFELTLFFSSKNRDANIIGLDTLNNEAIISSLSEDGFHRTPGEIEDRNAIKSEYLGGNISYEKRNLTIGFTAVANKIEATFEPRVSTYNKFSQLDNNNANVGADFSYLYKNLNIFGEAAHSIDGGYGHTLGALVVLDPRLSVGIQQRSFDKDFKPIQSNALGESSTNTNEQGTFLGIEAKPFKKLSISAYADRFVFPWLRFQTDAPSEGSRLLAQLTFRPSKKLEAYFRYRNRKRDRNNSNTGEQLNKLTKEITSNYRLHFSYQITNSIQIKNRIELTHYQLGNNAEENGIILYQDISYKQLGSPLSFTIRYALFDTDSYNSRIYAYESDVLYAFSIPAYSGRGTRFYFVTKCHVSRNVDLWFRYAQTYYTDRKSIGSGKDEINGNIRSDIKAQLRIKF